MHYESLILGINNDQCIVTVGFRREDWTTLKERFIKLLKGGVRVATEIKKWIPPKTKNQNDLFHVLCRKLGRATGHDEALIKIALKELFGVKIPNPFANKPMSESVEFYDQEQMHNIIMDTFELGERLRQEHTIDIDLFGEYEEYKELVKQMVEKGELPKNTSVEVEA